MASQQRLIEKLRGELIVSCQAERHEPLGKPEHILALCRTVILGGARALRLEGVENVRIVRGAVDVPIIALTKTENLSAEERLTRAYITPRFADAEALSQAGADIIALDATTRKRSDGLDLRETIEKVHKELKRPVWADCSTLDEGVNAALAGADIVSTTLYGYTKETALPDDAGPSFDFLAALVKAVTVPVVLEGRVWNVEEVSRAFATGAFAVVVGSAITRPHFITRRFMKAVPKYAAGEEDKSANNRQQGSRKK